jgi:serine/threonine-protein phosphatase 6 regulatory ankyrin repeat subunit B
MDQDPQVLGNQLVQAAHEGNNETVKALLAQGAPVDAKNNNGLTPLMWAAWNGHKDICELLLTHNAHVDAKDNNGSTPLILAAWNGHADVCKLLLTHKASAGAKNNFGNTPLIGAAQRGRKDFCELLLTHNAHIDAKNNDGFTPLMRAAINGHKDFCKCLIDAMILKQHKFTKNKRAVITFLGIRKRNECLGLILIGHDIVLCIAQMVFDMAKKDNVNAVEQINTIDNEALKIELLSYHQTQLSALQDTQSKEYRE